ncbi:MAG: DNA-processing protein DprA [Anaerolineae bacterium]|nr:DNA-processing protein DprA [Anaerolineae bacterium]
MIDPAWIALSLIDRVGRRTLDALSAAFHNDLHAVLAADPHDLQKVPGVGPKIARSIRAVNLDQVEAGIARWQQHGVRILTLRDADYPRRLRPLADAPPTLFATGQLDKGRYNNRPCAAIIGTRQPTAAARHAAQELALRLAERGYTIVSGLAYGIDHTAHQSALALPSGTTLAVLGCGVLNIYPAQHQELARAIMGRGLVLSECHPDAPPGPSALVARNRIITGLSDAVIVVETSTEGGAMHAARFASQQGRTLYALDYPASGNRALIEAGAIPLPADLRDLPF